MPGTYNLMEHFLNQFYQMLIAEKISEFESRVSALENATK